MRQLDDTDRAVIARLQYDGRKPFTEIAAELGISEGSVRRRVKLMTGDGTLQIVGVVEPGEPVDAQPMPFGEQLRRAVRLPVQDRNFARFLAFSVATVMVRYALPFYAVLARRKLEAPDNMAGTYAIDLTWSGRCPISL